MADIELKEVEKALTEAMADLTNLTVDTDIYRGGIPSQVRTGCGVQLLDDLQENEKYIPMMNFQITGKYTDRDNCWTVLTKLRKNLPAYGLIKNNILLMEILKRGDGAVVPTTSDGITTFEFFYNGILYFRDKTADSL